MWRRLTTSRQGGEETGGVWQTSVWVENVRQQFTIRIFSKINVNIKWAPKRPPEITNYDNIYQSEIYRKEIFEGGEQQRPAENQVETKLEEFGKHQS